MIHQARMHEDMELGCAVALIAFLFYFGIATRPMHGNFTCLIWRWKARCDFKTTPSLSINVESLARTAYNCEFRRTFAAH